MVVDFSDVLRSHGTGLEFSPCSSGGGAIAGIIIAFLAGVLTNFDNSIATWAGAHNPFFGGDAADLLALLPFAGLILVLWLTGRERILAGRRTA